MLTKLCPTWDKVLSCIFTANSKVKFTVMDSPASCRALRHAEFLLLDFLGNANDHRGELLLASFEGVAVGEGAAISSRDWVRLTRSSIVTDAAARRSASSMRANSP
jgi:hypothetical protein